MTNTQAYNRLIRLKNGDYATFEKMEGTRNSIWCLGKRGYQFLVANELPTLKHKTYRPQSQWHDLLVASALLGSWARKKPTGVDLFSEQELTSLDLDALPQDLRGKLSHKPDGLWLFTKQPHAKCVALEVEITAKTSERYEQTTAFYAGQPEVSHVIWIVKSRALAKRILDASKRYGVIREGVHLFIELADFEKHEWDASFLNESLKGRSMAQFLESRIQLSPRASLKNGLPLGCPSPALRPYETPKSAFLHFQLNLEKFDALRGSHSTSQE